MLQYFGNLTIDMEFLGTMSMLMNYKSNGIRILRDVLRIVQFLFFGEKVPSSLGFKF